MQKKCSFLTCDEERNKNDLFFCSKHRKLWKDFCRERGIESKIELKALKPHFDDFVKGAKAKEGGAIAS